MSVSNVDERVDAIIESLGTLRLARQTGVLDHVTQELAATFDAGAVSFRTVPGPAGWEIDFFHGHGFGLGTRLRLAMEAYLPKAPFRWASYDPLCPTIQDRNCVFGPRKMRLVCEARHPVVPAVYDPLGLTPLSQMRVLVCDGPFLLAWVGGWRAEPFEVRHERALRRLVSPLQQRLRIDRMLNGAGSMEAMALALEAIAAPSFLVRATGTIDLANEAGRLLFGRRKGALVAILRGALESPERHKEVLVIPVTSAGLPASALVVFRGTTASREARLAVVRPRWRLTPRQVEVLDLVARGDANKDIAVKLGCAPGTVGLHVSELLRKAGVESRTQLVARFWGEA